MKKLFTVLVAVCLTATLWAQSPQKMSYQAVIRNTNNNLIANTVIAMKISILQGSSSGTTVYEETQTPSTNANGLVNIEIGAGTVLSGNFAAINWANGLYFVKTETDPDGVVGGINYAITGISQLLSVPYALHAKTAESILNTNVIVPPSTSTTTATNILYNSATLNGIVNGNGFLTTVEFEWGLTTSYGNIVAATQSPIKGTNNNAVSKNIVDLKGNTTYHYRTKSTNAVDITYGEDLSFTTNKSIPEITTSQISNITSKSASSGGNVIFDGGSQVTVRGVCWSVNPNPTVNDSKTTDGTGSGLFSSSITNLAANTTYYIRAYATNEQGTAYGNEIIIKTTQNLENGLYIGGLGSSINDIGVDYGFSIGKNEAKNNEVRAGMYEKYVALEGNKEFYLLLKDGNTETRYSATLTNKELKGENDQPGTAEKPVIIQKGSLVVGASAPALKVNKSGLYHIVVDLNLDKSLDLKGGAQLIIAPVEWGLRGVNGDWGWKKMKSQLFNNTEMTWDTTIVSTKESSYMFSYGSGWKIQLDDAGTVKANTNLGVGNSPGGGTLIIGKGDNVKISLQWNLKTGDISNSYSLTTEASKWYYDEVSKSKFSLIGSAFNNASGTAPAAWDYDIDLPYVASKSTITDATYFYGTYVFEKSNVQLLTNGEFKIRRDNMWDFNVGYISTNIKGSTANFADAFGNIKVLVGGYYDIQFKFTSPTKTWELTLIKR